MADEPVQIPRLHARPSERRDDDTDAPRLPVCVVIPAYNRASTIQRCVASVWSQRPALPAEVIVVDDGSTDDTAAIAASLGAKVITHPENTGRAAVARNTGMHATSCEWIAFLDSDDEWLPHHLAHLWELRDQHALVVSSALRCGSDPNDDRFHGIPTREPLVLRSPDQLIVQNMFNISATMVRRDVAVALGGFQSWWGVEDFDLWVRVLERHTGISSPRVTVVYHVHEGQLSSEGDKMLAAHRAVAEAHRARTGGSSVPVQRWDGIAAWDRMRLRLAEGRRRAAVRSGLSILRSRQRAAGLAAVLWIRVLERRQSTRVDRDGEASVAILVRNEQQRRAVIDRVRGRAFRDLSRTSLPRALAELTARPAGVAIVGSRFHAALVRAVGVKPMLARRALNEGGPLSGD